MNRRETAIEEERPVDEALRTVAAHLQDAAMGLRDVLECYPLETAKANRLTAIRLLVTQAITELVAS